jgi:hypothetical protein
VLQADVTNRPAKAREMFGCLIAYLERVAFIAAAREFR